MNIQRNLKFFLPLALVPMTGCPAPTARVAEFSANGKRVCVVDETGDARCWGHNQSAQLGVNGSASTIGCNLNQPLHNLLSDVALAGAPTLVSIANAPEATCALTDEGTVRCWGSNERGTNGHPGSGLIGDQPGETLLYGDVDLNTTASVIQLEASKGATVNGKGFMCVLLDDGEVKCWGQNHEGTLGLGDTHNRGDDPGEMASLPAVDLGNTAEVVEIALGGAHACALFADGQAKCWGRNQHGQLGLGHDTRIGDQPGEMGDALPYILTDPTVGGTPSFDTLALGRYHSCGLSDGQVYCWGANHDGQLGLATDVVDPDDYDDIGDEHHELSTLQPVDAGGEVTDIFAAGNVTCAIVLGKAKCWGENINGVLGQGQPSGTLDAYGDDLGESVSSLPFIPLTAGDGPDAPGVISFVVDDLSVSGASICAKSSTDELQCWGRSSNCQLGIETPYPGDMGDAPGEIESLTAIPFDIES